MDCNMIVLSLKNIENKKIPWIEPKTPRFPQYLGILELINLPVTEKLCLCRWYWAARLSLQCTELGICKIESCVLDRDWKGICVFNRIEGIWQNKKNTFADPAIMSNKKYCFKVLNNNQVNWKVLIHMSIYKYKLINIKCWSKFLQEVKLFILSKWKRRNGNIFWENLKSLEYWMMIDVRQNIRAAAEPPSNLRAEKYYGVYYSLCLYINITLKWRSSLRTQEVLEIWK